MRKAIAPVLVVLVACLGLAVAKESGHSRGERHEGVSEFKTMVGVFGAFRGPANAIRGVPGAGAPWTNPEVEGELNADGKLEMKIEGLVLVSNGINPLASFGAIMSCVTVDPRDPTKTVNVNVATDRTFPATRTGNAHIEAELELPHPCVAPIVFVTTPTGGRWLAATGN